MNKPKFRAYDEKEKVMRDVRSIFYNEDFSIAHIVYPLEDDVSVLFDNFILMQYTGLKDKNGVEIYEGDVLKVSDHPFDNNGNFNGNYEVGWDERDLTYLAGNLLLFRLAPYIEVIGSVHENPELLSGVEYEYELKMREERFCDGKNTKT